MHYVNACHAHKDTRIVNVDNFIETKNEHGKNTQGGKNRKAVK